MRDRPLPLFSLAAVFWLSFGPLGVCAESGMEPAFGLFTNEGRVLSARIGKGDLMFDRHAGGIVLPGSGTGRAGVGTCVNVLLDENGKAILLSQRHDPNPRFVFLEEGPVRLGIRVLFSLLDGSGRYYGEGMQEVWLYRNGLAVAGAAVRVFRGRGDASVGSVWLELEVGSEVKAIEDGRGNRIQPTSELPFAETPTGRIVFKLAEGGAVGVSRLLDQGRAFEAGNRKGPWDRTSPAPPFYDSWGTLYDQWGESYGWDDPSRAGRAVVGPAGRVRLFWPYSLTPSGGRAMSFRGIFSVARADSAGEVDHLGRTAWNPVTPVVRGGELKFRQLIEGVFVLAKRSPKEPMEIVLPPDGEDREQHIRVVGLSGGRAVRVRTGGKDLPVQLVAPGKITDDPYGPHGVRPDDRHGAIIVQPSHAGEAVFSVSTKSKSETQVSVEEVEGFQIVYQRWDDRRMYAIYSPFSAERPITVFSPRDGKLREIRLSGDDRPTVSLLPLYWLKANAASALEAYNRVIELRASAGAAGVSLAVVGTRPDNEGRSSVRVRLTAARSDVSIHGEAEIVPGKGEEGPVQYLNLFPSDSRLPEDWLYDRFLAAARGDRRMEVVPAGGTGSVKGGIDVLNGPLFAAYYSAKGPSLFILAESGTETEFAFCRVWMDSHFSARAAPQKAVRAKYSIRIDGRGYAPGQINEMAERVLERGWL